MVRHTAADSKRWTGLRTIVASKKSNVGRHGDPQGFPQGAEIPQRPAPVTMSDKIYYVNYGMANRSTTTRRHAAIA